MARISSADVGWLLAGGYSVLGDVTMLDDEREAIVEDSTVLGTAWEEHQYVGVKRWKLTQEGFFNDVALGHNVAFVTPGASKVLCYAPEGNTKGAKVVGSSTVQGSYTRMIQRGALTKARVVFESESNHDEGKIVATLTSRGAASNTRSDSLDNSAASTNGAVAYLQCTALSLGGYTNLQILVEDSADNASFSTIGTFTALTAAPGSQRLVIAGTIRRYLAVSWSYGGAGAGPTGTWTVGVARG